MITNIVKIEHKVNDKVFHLLCDNDTPLIIVREALFQFLKIIGQIEDEIKANQETKAEEKKVEESQEPTCQIEQDLIKLDQ